jgi:Flp pilus assembly protein TadD
MTRGLASPTGRGCIVNRVPGRSKVGKSKRCEFAETGKIIGTNRISRKTTVPASGLQDLRTWQGGSLGVLSVAQWCRCHPIAAYILASILWTTVLYAHAATAGFASYDDAPQIVQNPSLSSLAASLKYFQSPVSFASDLHGSGASFYRPLFWLSLAIDERLWGLNPIAFHLTNVLLHWLTGFFLFLLLRRLHISSVSSALTSLLWICLPINSEAVAWISGRPYCLVTCFLLLGTLLADLYLCRPAVRYLIGYCLAASCALLSHEEGVLIVAFTLLVVLAKRQGKSKPAMVLYAVSVFAALLYLRLRHAVGATGVPGKGAMTSFGLFFWKYLAWMVLPIHMSIERSTDTPPSGWSGHALAAWIFVALACAALIFAHREISRSLIGLALMGIGLLPFCGIVFIYQGMAERYAYLASAGLALMVVVIGVESQVTLRPVVLGLIAVWTVWSVYRLETRISDWSDAARLYGHSLQATPRSAKLHYDLGAVFEESKDFAQANREYNQAVSLEPHYEPALAGLGNVDLNLGRAREASEMFEKALQVKPDDAKALTNYGTALESLGKIDDAKAQYQRAISLAPDDDSAYCDLGVLLFRTGDTEAAVWQFDRAAKIDPSDPTPLLNLAVIYQKGGRPDLAVRLYERVLQLSPGDPDAILALQTLLANSN